MEVEENYGEDAGGVVGMGGERDDGPKRKSCTLTDLKTVPAAENAGAGILRLCASLSACAFRFSLFGSSVRDRLFLAPSTPSASPLT